MWSGPGTADPVADPVAVTAGETSTRLRSFRSRLPVAYPALLGVTYVLLMLDATGVSPYAALRPLIVIGLGAYLVTAVLSALLGNRDAAAAATLVLLLALLSLNSQLVLAALLAIAAFIVILALAGRVRRIRIRWHVITRVLSIVTAIAFLAVGIRSVQDGRATQVFRDLVNEGPLRAAGTRVAVDAAHPDVYLILLDGYPRSDKLHSEFGVDDAGFLDALRQSGFDVATHSRSNYLHTQLTLESMFNGRLLDDAVYAESLADVHADIDQATAWRPFAERGYETVSIPSDFEIVAMRNVDRFLDTGQFNEFERVLVEKNLLPLVDLVAPGFFERQHRARVADSFSRAEDLAGEDGPARLSFIHIASPHSPLRRAVDAGTDAATTYNVFDDKEQFDHLGAAEYGRRLATEVGYVDEHVLSLLDKIDASGRPSVVAVFSDHGSGAHFDTGDESGSDIDLRSANLLAVRGLGDIDDRSTLVNLLPTMAEHLFDVPFTPAADSVEIIEKGTILPFQRPD